MHLSHKQQSVAPLMPRQTSPRVNGVRRSPTGEFPSQSFGDESRRDMERAAPDIPKPTALAGTEQASNYVNLPTPLSPLPPAYPYVLSIYTQLVSSPAGFPGAVNEQKLGLYDHNNQLSFFCLPSPPPQALEE